MVWSYYKLESHMCLSKRATQWDAVHSPLSQFVDICTLFLSLTFLGPYFIYGALFFTSQLSVWGGSINTHALNMFTDHSARATKVPPNLTSVINTATRPHNHLWTQYTSIHLHKWSISKGTTCNNSAELSKHPWFNKGKQNNVFIWA